MCKNTSDIKDARRKKRDKTGWSMEEIKENAKKELDEFREISDDEPENLVSGDMEKIIRGENEDD